MSTTHFDIPPGLHALYDAAGPILKYRILRDLCDQDESWIRTAALGRDLDKLPEVIKSLKVLASPRLRSLAFDMLRLCEAGREEHPLVQAVIEKGLLPTIARDDLLWEYSGIASGTAEKILAHRLVRDTALHLICRALRTQNELLREQLEILLNEWARFAAGKDDEPPTLEGFAAVCWYPWEDDEFPRVRDAAVLLFSSLEEEIGESHSLPDWFDGHRLKLDSKEIYLAEPARLLHFLELSARLGISLDLPVTSWLLDELQIRQDADGMVRFENSPSLSADLSWYFPLEAAHPEDYPIEFTFRALLIYKLLSYDF